MQKIKMKTLRTIHLYLSLFVSPTILLFALGAIPIAHHALNPATTSEDVRSFEIPADMLDARTTASYLAQQHGIRGKLSARAADAEALRFALSRIGQHHEVAVAAPEGAGLPRIATVTTQTKSLSGFLIGLHTEVGIRDGAWPGTLWRGLLGLIAIAMLGIVLTGAILWLRRPKRQRPGQLVLAASLTLGLLLLSVIRSSG